jgi:hypothetical protein
MELIFTMLKNVRTREMCEDDLMTLLLNDAIILLVKVRIPTGTGNKDAVRTADIK